MTSDLVIVSAASSGHFRSLFQFLRSVERYEPHAKCIVYGLRLSADETDRLRRRFPSCEQRTFEFERYPPHFDIAVDNGAYAWKPAIIWEVLCESSLPVCWMDAGNALVGKLDGLKSAIKRNGFYSPYSPGSLGEWTHPGMLRFFGLDASWAYDTRNLNGACMAFDPSCGGARKVAEDWMRLALNKECIAPEGSSRENHRYDQALLTILAERSGFAEGSAHEYLGFKPHQDVETYKARALLRSIKRTLQYWAYSIREAFAGEAR